MKIYQKTIQPAKEYSKLVSIQCDLCGEVSSKGWKQDSFDATETEVFMRTGHSYPLGGGGEHIEIDICPLCFVNKLIPWVKEQGGNPTVTEWEC